VLREQIELLRRWDYRWDVGSVAMTLAIHWADHLWEHFVSDRLPDDDDDRELEHNGYVATLTTPNEKLEALAAISDQLEGRFGTWKTAWGEINRLQRLTGPAGESGRDEAPSIPVGFGEGWTGSLATFTAVTPSGGRKRYGMHGNSFVAVVEFGDRVRARAVLVGGQSADPSSRHFNDQALRYATGDLRDVYFYRSDVERHAQREYRPGRQAF
jgi:acyl-homoserine-lactone acylase